MAARNPQTMAKRAREQAVREKRERKRAKKLESAESRAAAREAEALGLPLPATSDPEEAAEVT